LARADCPLGRRAQQRIGAKRTTTGFRIIDRSALHFDLLQIAIGSLRPGDGQPRKHLVHPRIVLDVYLDILAAEVLFGDDQRRRNGRRRRRTRTRLCRRVVQHCWVRRDAPHPGRTSVGVRRRVVIGDRPVVEVEADRGQVRRLEGHKVGVVEVPAVDVPRERVLELRATDRDDGVLWVVVRLDPRVRDRQWVLTPLRRAVDGDAPRGISGDATVDRR